MELTTQPPIDPSKPSNTNKWVVTPHSTRVKVPNLAKEDVPFVWQDEKGQSFLRVLISDDFRLKSKAARKPQKATGKVIAYFVMTPRQYDMYEVYGKSRIVRHLLGESVYLPAGAEEALRIAASSVVQPILDTSLKRVPSSLRIDTQISLTRAQSEDFSRLGGGLWLRAVLEELLKI